MDIRVVLVFLFGVLLLDGNAVVFASDSSESDRDSTGPSTDDRRAETAGDGAGDTVDQAKNYWPSTGGTEANAKELELFRRAYKQKREQQQLAVEDILGKYNYQQQHKLVEMVIERMLEVLQESKEQLATSTFKPGKPFPLVMQDQEAVSLLFENLAFFGDMALRLPEITHSLYSKKKQLRDIVKWTFSFTRDTGFLEESQWKLFHLMSQELNLVKRDPDFINPYKKVVPPEPAQPKTKKPKKAKKKGPRLSRSEL